jgi:hypothetical protein
MNPLLISILFVLLGPPPPDFTDLRAHIRDLDKRMKQAARLRDEIRRLEAAELEIGRGLTPLASGRHRPALSKRRAPRKH